MTNQRKLKHPDQELSVSYRKMVVWQINAFFRYGFNAEWDDMPARPPLSTADVPRGVHKVPRYIPEQELEPLMERIRALECPLQRCALLDRPLERSAAHRDPQAASRLSRHLPRRHAPNPLGCG